MTVDEVPLRYLVTCLDGRRVPLNSSERSTMPGPFPYWGAGSVVDHVDRFLFDEELVLLGEDGAPFFDSNRNVAFHVVGRVWVNNHIHVLRPNRRVDARFLTYSLNVVDYSRYIGGSTRDKLTQDDMREIVISLPLLEDQRRIADFLDDQVTRIDSIVAARSKQIAAAVELRDSELSFVVRDMYRSCPVTTLARFSDLVEQGSSPSDSANEPGSGFSVLRTSAIANGEFRGEMAREVSASAFQTRFEVQEGDLLIVRGSGSARLVGDVAHVQQLPSGTRTMLSDLIYRFVGLRLDPVFTAAVLLSAPVRSQLRLAVRQGSGPAKIRGEDIRSLRVPIPSRADQISFGQLYREREREVKDTRMVLELSIDKLNELKRSLITSAVTGEFDVTAADGSQVPV